MLNIKSGWASIRKLPLIRKIKVIFKAIAYSLVAWWLVSFVSCSYKPAGRWLEFNELFFFTRFYKNPVLAQSNGGAHATSQLIIIDSEDPTRNRARADYANLINELNHAGAVCIAMDIQFSESKTWDAGGQSELAQAIAAHPHVVLPIRFVKERQAESDSIYAVVVDMLKRKYALNQQEADHFQFVTSYDDYYIDHPILEITQGTNAVGHINFEAARPHLNPLVLGHEQHLYPSFSFSVARAYLQSQGVNFDIRDIPTAPYSRMLIRYLPANRFEKLSLDAARTLLRSNTDRFAGKIALIVNTPGEPPLADTPLDQGAYPPWAVHASLICQILDNSNIVDARLRAVLLALVLVVIGLIWLLFFSERFKAGWRRLRWVLLAYNLIVIGMACLFLQADYWLGVTVPVFLGIVGITSVRYDLNRIYELPAYDDFAITVTEAEKDYYSVSLTYSPAGEDEGKISFTRFFEKAEFIKRLEALQENEATMADMQYIGRELFGAVFQESIEHRLQFSLELARRSQSRIRLQLRFDAPEISRLPWEYMNSEKMAPNFLALNPNTSITRYIPFGVPADFAEFRGPLRILVAISQPIDLPQLDTTMEKNRIMMVLRTSLSNLVILGQAKVTFLEHATREKLSQCIADGKFDVFHFIGHSDFDAEDGGGSIMLEDDEGNAAPEAAEGIGMLLIGSTVRLAVLNSCEGAVASTESVFHGVAQKIVRVGVPAVVAMQHKVFDTAAIEFASSFYYSLLTHYSVDAAVHDARQSLFKKFGLAKQAWGTPVLFMRTGGAEVFGRNLEKWRAR